MADLTVVSNAGPLIALSSINRMELLRLLFGSIYIPDAVYREVVTEGGGRAGEAEVREADWIRRRKARNRTMVKLLRDRLDAGESETIITEVVQQEVSPAKSSLHFDAKTDPTEKIRQADVATLLGEFGVETVWSDKTYPGRPIDVSFTGVLREDQELAMEAMLEHDCGVLSATTAFGKTVIAARLIAERKTNSLILTHRQQPLSQWIKKLSQFLEIHEALPVVKKKRGRKPKQSLIGQQILSEKSPKTCLFGSSWRVRQFT